MTKLTIGHHVLKPLMSSEAKLKAYWC